MAFHPPSTYTQRWMLERSIPTLDWPDMQTGGRKGRKMQGRRGLLRQSQNREIHEFLLVFTSPSSNSHDTAWNSLFWKISSQLVGCTVSSQSYFLLPMLIKCLWFVGHFLFFCQNNSWSTNIESSRYRYQPICSIIFAHVIWHSTFKREKTEVVTHRNYCATGAKKWNQITNVEHIDVHFK